MQLITAVPIVMGRPSFQWGTTTELPGMLFQSIIYKPLRGARWFLLGLVGPVCGSELKNIKIGFQIKIKFSQFQL